MTTSSKPRVHAEITIGESGWAVTWNPETNTTEYMAAQFAFEAKRAAERELKGRTK